jgi:hypothetical protein
MTDDTGMTYDDYALVDNLLETALSDPDFFDERSQDAKAETVEMRVRLRATMEAIRPTEIPDIRNVAREILADPSPALPEITDAMRRQAILAAVDRELDISRGWDESKGYTLEQLLSGNTDALVDDCYEDWFPDAISSAEALDRVAMIKVGSSILGIDHTARALPAFE